MFDNPAITRLSRNVARLSFDNWAGVPGQFNNDPCFLGTRDFVRWIRKRLKVRPRGDLFDAAWSAQARANYRSFVVDCFVGTIIQPHSTETLPELVYRLITIGNSR